jgi:tRNA (guanine-N7-)-methyltransferase
MINPDDYVIARKRKKYKFAKFANSTLCFELEEWKKQPVDVIEIGAGTSLFSVELAAKYPKKKFVAIDVKADRLQKGAYIASERGLTNIYFLRARADQLGECFDSKSIEKIWITFPDPFPRERSERRRLTHPLYLSIYQPLLKKSGAVYIKHDSRDFFLWTLEQLVRKEWSIKELSFNLHESELSDEYKIMTTYEERWLAEGTATNFVRAIR